MCGCDSIQLVIGKIDLRTGAQRSPFPLLGRFRIFINACVAEAR